MKKTMMRVSAALLMAASLGSNAWGGCVSDADMAALKTAALQQELMVAAFSCHDVDLHNRFVRAHQPELVQSDGRLKAYFIQHDGAKRGEANYHTYKTELANSSSLRSLHDDGFCDRASAEFDATSDHASLLPILDTHRWAIEATYRACLAEAEPRLADVSSTMPTPRTQLVATGPARPGRLSDGDVPRHAEAQDVKTPLPHPPLPGLADPQSETWSTR